MRDFPPRRHYNSLSARDLIVASDATHLPPLQLTDVVATAIGGRLYDQHVAPAPDQTISATALLRVAKGD
jgi:hypothetical protein